MLAQAVAASVALKAHSTTFYRSLTSPQQNSALSVVILTVPQQLPTISGSFSRPELAARPPPPRGGQTNLEEA
jgi:hypothetical protein